jgi:putative transposase
MARLARIVVPHVPHRLTQRGNRRQPVFFGDDDDRADLDLLGLYTRRADAQVWAWCPMPNHVDLLKVPASEGALGSATTASSSISKTPPAARSRRRSPGRRGAA